ncbi:hypothetical protein [Paraburkholderia phenazinium]|jgi:hypothetical protein|nr:hypothetical protein [Paraburkholderia phenazinium]
MLIPIKSLGVHPWSRFACCSLERGPVKARARRSKQAEWLSRAAAGRSLCAVQQETGRIRKAWKSMLAQGCSTRSAGESSKRCARIAIAGTLFTRATLEQAKRKLRIAFGRAP